MTGKMNKAKSMKTRHILPHLAVKGMMNNGAAYYPYLAAGIFSVFTFFVFSSILHNDIISTLPKSVYAWMFLSMGRVLLGIILLPFLFYTNSFLMKRRKKEVGLYNILGLEKKHIGTMLFAESFLTYLVAVGMGIISGVVLTKLLFLLLLRMTGLPVDAKFTFSLSAFGETAIFFFWVYAINFISNLIQVGIARPADLLSGSKKGEKEPKLLWVWAALGAVALGFGYKLAIYSEADSMIFTNFFFAIFWVVGGTYLLFTSGSVAFLKLLKKKKKFYYKPSNFITVSGMLYRMKKNAASLVNICIFSTMVMITLVCTFSLYLGLEDMMDFSFPFDFNVYLQEVRHQEGDVEEKARELAGKYGVEIKNYISYERITLAYGKKGENFGIVNGDVGGTSSYLTGNYDVNIFLEEDYNRMEGRNLALGEGEAAVFSSGKDYGYDRIVFLGKEMKVKEEPESLRIAPKSENNVHAGQFYLVVKDETAREGLVKDWATKNCVADVKGLMDGRYRMVRLDVTGEEMAREAFGEEFWSWCVDELGCVRADNNISTRSDQKSMYGGLLFIGILFSIVFLMCLLLIMYYKQIAEGYEDQGAFEIMQKVGMSDREIRGTIRRQILLVFFVPVLGAVLHTCAGLVMVGKLFEVLGFFDMVLLKMCAAGVILVFAGFYGASYVATARTYYGIVSRK